ncbi:rna-directed dna polymerase from mobile element jockey-like [Willisornis vidua]|uniref:Rna-directed dna polymerase from mobile element jockey-like n=1 Tax=Willisornis vidua TaxID=1566151 RepID=A0ABQ9CU98_9PASS|nr:rna-directed dna polymerase from mobile element jockey-like [Willisornis vidua]
MLKDLRSDLMSKCRAVTSGISQGLVLGMVLFSIYVSEMDYGIECILRKSADDTQLCGAFNMLEGRDAIQKDQDRLERWTHVKLMTCNKDKVLHLSWTNHKHMLGNE